MYCVGEMTRVPGLDDVLPSSCDCVCARYVPCLWPRVDQAFCKSKSHLTTEMIQDLTRINCWSSLDSHF